MPRAPRFSDLSFASKILLLMGLLGLISVVITAYALTNMRAVNQQYRDLIEHEAQGALTIAEAARNLNGASRLAYTVLTEPDEARMLASLDELGAIRLQYDAELRKLKALLPDKAEQVMAIKAGSQRLFQTAEHIILAASRWRGDQALQLIHREFEPALLMVRTDMDALRDDAVSQFGSASDTLRLRTSRTILVAAMAVVGALALVLPLSIHVAIAQMSRPLSQLTHTMKRMSQRHYDDEIVLTHRRDEVGQMANALQVFQQSMQREDRLAVEVAASAEAARLSEQLVDLISTIPGAVFQMEVATDGSRRVLFASERSKQLHGYAPAELEQAEQPSGQEFRHASEEEVQKAHAAFVRSVRTLAPLNFDTKTTQSGKVRWIKTLAAARRTAAGGALFNGVWLDVTDQKEQAQALTQAKHIAEKSAADKARFLATMSHEIRTPLNAILGMTQLAMHHEREAPQRERIAKTLRAGRHLLNIVNDVLDISKIEARKLVIAPEDFSTREWATEIRDLFIGEAQAKGLDLLLHIAPGTLERLRGDRQRMSQVLINYLNNAIKFTSAGTVTLSINTQEGSDKAWFLRGRVQDTGMGIAESERETLFRAFEQGDSAITRGFGGTGLGLAISRQLAELMGGAAGVSSEPGKGSTFWFTARVETPASEGSLTSLEPSDEVATIAHGLRLSDRGLQFYPGARVLLVDDNELNRAVAHGLLELGGITVDEACDGAQALATLEAAANDTYCLVLMDMQMPVMDGLAAARALRQNPRFAHLPVIALTANASADDIARTREAGMQDHLSKPLLEESLMRCMRRWMPTRPSRTDASLSKLDVAVLQELKATLGVKAAHALTANFLRDCDARLFRMKALTAQSAPIDWDSLANESHDLSGSAGSFGLAHLGEMAQRFNAIAREKNAASTRSAMDSLLENAQVDLAALREYADAHTFEASVR